MTVRLEIVFPEVSLDPAVRTDVRHAGGKVQHVIDMRQYNLTVKWTHGVPLGKKPASGVECVFGEFDVDDADGTKAEMASRPG